MPEDNDYTPSSWSTDTSFADAKRDYDVHVGRSYDDAVKTGIIAADLLPARISTNARVPIVVLNDLTGSMGTWPATIFSKLGYLDHEAKFYFDEDYAIAFGSFGDANYREQYPVQMRPFAKEAELQERLKELVIERGGGGTVEESSELSALYVHNNVDIPNAFRPILIIITDEKCYSTISPDQAKTWAKVDLQQRMTAKDLFAALKTNWSIYVIRKPYGSDSTNTEDSRNRDIRLFWEDLVGADHIANLPDASRVVDVIFGIFAQETGKVEEFRKELRIRQLKDVGGDRKVATVDKALLDIHGDGAGRKRSQKLLPGSGSGPTKKLTGPADKKSDGDTKSLRD